MIELDCRTALPALHRYVDGESPPSERTAVEVHLASCAECRLTLRALRREADLLAQVAIREEPPADLFDRVRAELPSRRAMFFVRHRAAVLAAAAVLVLGVLSVVAGALLEVRPAPVAVVYTAGEAQACTGEDETWEPVRTDRALAPGTLVRAQAGRTATVEFEDWTQLTLRGGSRLAVLGQRRGVMHCWRLDEGELWATFGQGRFRVDTAAGSAAGDGCELAVRVTGRRLAQAAGLWPAAYAEEPETIPRATIVVVRGTARAWNDHGSVEVKSGMETCLEPGRPPMTPRPADLEAALAWTHPTVAAAVPAPDPLAGFPPVPLPSTPFEESTGIRPAIVPPPLPMPEPERPPIVIESVEGPPPGPPSKVRAEALVGRTVVITWEAPATGAAPAAYKVWRKAAGEDSYKQLTIPSLAATRRDERLAYTYTDHNIADGMTYAYRVSALDALTREGSLSEPVTVTARDFVLSYQGGSADLAVIYVTRRVGSSWVTHRFEVRQRDPAKGATGVVGEPVRRDLGRGPQTVDFRTGCVLVNIEEAPHPATGTPTRRLVLEDEHGRREYLWLAITRTNGQ